LFKKVRKIFLPIFDVPNICTKKRAIIITTVIGKIHLLSDSDVVAIPSTADKTLIAGVRAPSPEQTKKSGSHFFFKN
jgi:hypothetical protein